MIRKVWNWLWHRHEWKCPKCSRYNAYYDLRCDHCGW